MSDELAKKHKAKISVKNIAGGAEGVTREVTRDSYHIPTYAELHPESPPQEPIESTASTEIPIDSYDNQVSLEQNPDLAVQLTPSQSLTQATFGRESGDFLGFNEQGAPQIVSEKPKGNLQKAFEDMNSYLLKSNDLSMDDLYHLRLTADNLYEKRSSPNILGQLFFSSAIKSRDRAYGNVVDRISRAMDNRAIAHPDESLQYERKLLGDHLQYLEDHQEQFKKIAQASIETKQSIHMHKRESVLTKGVVNEGGLAPPMSMEILPDGNVAIISSHEIGRGSFKKAKKVYVLDKEGKSKTMALLRVNPDVRKPDNMRKETKAIAEIQESSQESSALNQIRTHMRNNGHENLLDNIESQTIYAGNYQGEKGGKHFVIKDLVEPEMETTKGQKSAELFYLFHNKELLNKVFPDLKSKLLFMKKISETVAAIHDAGYVHRDIKPENVFIRFTKDANGEITGAEPVISDFGFAAKEKEATGLKGTPSHMAPEVWRKEKGSKKSDVYSLGVLFYEMFGAYDFVPKDYYGVNSIEIIDHKADANSFHKNIFQNIDKIEYKNTAQLLTSMFLAENKRPSATGVSKKIAEIIKSIDANN